MRLLMEINHMHIRIQLPIQPNQCKLYWLMQDKGRAGTWALPCRHGLTLSCFVPFQIMSFRHRRHVGPCPYGVVNLFFGPSTTHGNAGTSLGRAGSSTTLKIPLLVLFFAHDIKYIYIYIYKIYVCIIVVEISSVIFVSCRPKHGPKCKPSHVACCVDILGTTRPSCFVSCWHNSKYFVSCHISGHAKRSCHSPPTNGTTQVPALDKGMLHRVYMLCKLMRTTNQTQNHWEIFL